MKTPSPNSQKPSIAAVVLAAGKGTRMRSSVPKVLHPVAGRPMLDWVLGALEAAGVAKACLVLGPDHTAFSEILADRPELVVAIQHGQAGTGDGVASAAVAFAKVAMPQYARGELVRGNPLTTSHVLVCASDTPAIRSETLATFVAAAMNADAGLAVLAMDVPSPFGYGRIVTGDAGRVTIVEERDASAEIRRITICNTGVILARTDLLFSLLGELKPENAQKEYYLTDCFALAGKRGVGALVHVTKEWREFAGINDRAQLAELESQLIASKRRALMQSGVTIRLPESVYVDDTVSVGPESVIESGVVLTGSTVIGHGCRIGAGAVLHDAVVGDGAEIGAGAVVNRSRVAAGQRILSLSVVE